MVAFVMLGAAIGSSGCGPRQPAAGSAAAAGAPPMQLITSDEARQPDAVPGEVRGVREGVTAGDPQGPEIVVDSPEDGKHYQPPVAIEIAFRPRASQVDVTSLEVAYLKWISIDITDRVRPYATASGIRVANAELPKGSHKVRVTIADVEGRKTERTMQITVD